MGRKAAVADPIEEVKRQAAAARDAVLDKLDPLRDEIARLQDEIAAVHNSLPSRGEVEHRVNLLLGEVRGNTGYALGKLLTSNPRWPVQPISDAVTSLREQSPIALLAAVLGTDGLRTWMLGELDRHAQALGGWPQLDAEGRKRQAADLKARLLELEREEERLITAAAEVGVQIERRYDADPRAILGLRR